MNIECPIHKKPMIRYKTEKKNKVSWETSEHGTCYLLEETTYMGCQGRCTLKVAEVLEEFEIQKAQEELAPSDEYRRIEGLYRGMVPVEYIGPVHPNGPYPNQTYIMKAWRFSSSPHQSSEAEIQQVNLQVDLLGTAAPLACRITHSVATKYLKEYKG